MRPRRLLQLRGANARRRRHVSSRPIVHRGSGAAGRADSVGQPPITFNPTREDKGRKGKASTLVMDLSVQIGSLTLKNPLIAASGCFGYGVEYADVIDLASLGAVAVKGLFLAERD